MSDEEKKAVIVGELNDYGKLIRQGIASVRIFVLEVIKDEKMLEEFCEYGLYDGREEEYESQELEKIIEFIQRGKFDDKTLEYFFDVVQHQKGMTTKMLCRELNKDRVEVVGRHLCNTIAYLKSDLMAFKKGE